MMGSVYTVVTSNRSGMLEMSNQNDMASLLIFRLGSVGDTVVALPSFRLIKKAFPNARRFVLTNIPVNQKACALAAILENTQLVDEFIEYPSKSSLWKKCIEMRRIIQTHNFTMMVYLHQNRSLLNAWRDFLFFKLCGVKKIIGLSLFRHGFQYQYDAEKKIYEHESHRLARQIKELGEINWCDPEIMNLALTQDELNTTKDMISDEIKQHPFIVCSIGTKLSINDWGQENWKQLMLELSQTHSDYPIVFIGVKDEYARSEELLNQWSGKKLNLCGRLSIRQSAVVLGMSTLFVGHDSGPMHLAAAAKTPCVAIFSRHNPPGWWFPYGDEHIIFYPRGDAIQSILVNEVRDGVIAALKKKI